MRDIPSSLGSFSLIDHDNQSLHESSLSDSPFDWKPRYWTPLPLPPDYDFNPKPWTRPTQLPMSFVGVDLIDVEDGRVLKDRTVKIRSGFIEEIRQTQQGDLEEEGWTSIDSRGLYMCPGLIDCEFCPSCSRELTQARPKKVMRI